MGRVERPATTGERRLLRAPGLVLPVCRAHDRGRHGGGRGRDLPLCPPARGRVVAAPSGARARLGRGGGRPVAVVRRAAPFLLWTATAAARAPPSPRALPPSHHPYPLPLPSVS